MKRITAFLLTVAITFTIISPSVLHAAADEATNMVVGEQETVADGQVTASDETEKTEKTTATEVDGIVVEVFGDALPKDAEVVADSSPNEKKEALTDAIMGESDEENNAFSLDISLEADGITTQPNDDSVTVSLSGIELGDCETVTVYHVMDDASSIAKRLDIKSDILTYTLDNDSASHFEKEIAAFCDALALSQTEETFDENTICVEEISTENGLSVDTESGIISFDTDSFSTYYVAQGTSATERKYSTKSIIKFGDTNVFGEKSTNGSSNDTFYIAPNSVITFFSVNTETEDDDVTATWTFYDNGSVMTCNTASTQKSATITIPETAVVGSRSTLTVAYTYDYTYTYTYKEKKKTKTGTRTEKRTNTYTATLVVDTNDNIIENARTHNRVMLTVVPEPQKNGIPTEPSLASGFGWKIINGNYVVAPTSAQGTKFSENGSNIIKNTIKNVLTQSVDGSHTWGYFNTDGDIKNYLQNIDWDLALDKLIAYKGFYGTDGVEVTSSNKNDYELIPYVIKLQSLSGVSWNIDCYIKRKVQVTLSYDANLGNGVTVLNKFGLPNSETINKNDSVTVGKISYNGNVLSVGSTIDVRGPDGLTYKYKFLGWGTNSTSVNNSYDPGDKPTLNDNVKLYAIWGKQVKICYNANGGTISSDKQTQYSLDSSGFIKKSSESTRYYENNWYYDEPHENGLTNNTTFGLSRKGYVFQQWDTKPDGTGQRFDQDDKNVKVSIFEQYLENKDKSRCLNLYAQWKLGLGNIKITTDCFDNVDENQVFIFVVKGTSDLGEEVEIRVPIKGNGSALVTDVPFGTYTVSCESEWSWRYGSSDSVKVTIDKMDETVDANFTQKCTDTQWLSGCAYKKNEFKDKNENKNEENA